MDELLGSNFMRGPVNVTSFAIATDFQLAMLSSFMSVEGVNEWIPWLHVDGAFKTCAGWITWGMHAFNLKMMGVMTLFTVYLKTETQLDFADSFGRIHSQVPIITVCKENHCRMLSKFIELEGRETITVYETSNESNIPVSDSENVSMTVSAPVLVGGVAAWLLGHGIAARGRLLASFGNHFGDDRR